MEEITKEDMEALLKKSEDLEAKAKALELEMEIALLHSEIMQNFESEDDLNEYLEWELDRVKAI